MILAEMIRVFTLPDEMAWTAYKNDRTRLIEAELVTQMMCVDSGTATDFAHAAFAVVNTPADLLPLDRIHKLFVFHEVFMQPAGGFRCVGHEILEDQMKMFSTARCYPFWRLSILGVGVINHRGCGLQEVHSGSHLGNGGIDLRHKLLRRCQGRLPVITVEDR